MSITYINNEKSKTTPKCSKTHYVLLYLIKVIIINLNTGLFEPFYIVRWQRSDFILLDEWISAFDKLNSFLKFSN